jgi:LacI family transcriptional regulator
MTASGPKLQPAEHAKSRATILTVARAAGVSVSTVSQVMRGGGRISDTTRRKVLRVAEELNYVRNRGAAAMRTGDSRELGFLLNDIGNPFNAEVLAGVNASLTEMGYLVYVLDGQDDPALQEQYLRTLTGVGLGGLLWVPAHGTSAEVVNWVAQNSPATVTLLRALPEAPFDHVGIDSAAGTSMATEHLIELGHRHIAFLGNEHDSSTVRHRIGGYMSTMLAIGAAPPIVERCAENKAAAKAQLGALLDKHPQVTALVCNCDVVAAGAALGAAERGLSVGRDLSIVGFDDIEDARLWVPPLTTVAVDPKGLGQQLAEAFLARKTDPQARVKAVNLPVSLKVRASSGPVQRSQR